MALKSIVGSNGFADWVRALKHKSGAYRIVRSGQTLYVGQSSKDRLYGTLTRHFQRWDRTRAGDMTGYVFDRYGVMVEVIVTASGEPALAQERAWIERFAPLLNREEMDAYKESPVEDDLIDALVDVVNDDIPF